jgi:hypothetical protein
MGKKKGHSSAQETQAKPAARGRDSEDAESETSAMSGTSLDKRRLAQTREELREAGGEALRMAAAHETPTETPIYGPGNIFDAGDDDDTELEVLRTQNAALQRRLRMHDSTGAATGKRVAWKPNSLQAMSSEAPALAEPKDICPFGNTSLIGLDFIPLCSAWSGRNARCSRKRSSPTMRTMSTNFALLTPLPPITTYNTTSTWPLKGFWASPSW